MRGPVHNLRPPGRESYETARIPGLGPSAGPAGQSDMSFIGGNARLQCVRPAKCLQPGQDLDEIHIGVVAAGAADDLEDVGVAVQRPAIHDPDWLAPQERRKAVAGLTSGRNHRCVSARLWAAGAARCACPVASRLGPRRTVHSGPAHLSRRLFCDCRGLEQH
jgi:hypothetical protein